MTVIIKKPAQPPFIRVVDNTLESLQKLVGGYIETIILGKGLILIYNEEGKLLGLPDNFRVEHDMICGTAVFVSSCGEEFCSLSREQQRFLMRSLS